MVNLNMSIFSSLLHTIIITLCLIGPVFPAGITDRPIRVTGIHSDWVWDRMPALFKQPGGLTSGPDLERLDAFIEDQMRQNRIPGLALAITQGDRILYLRGYGNAASNQAVTPQTPFYIGSVSKSFTALAVLQLVEEGAIQLDAPLQTYIPWFRVADERLSSAITVRHLLNQTSGLGRGDQNRDMLPADATIEEAVRNLQDIQPSLPPGEMYQYFNANYTILGLLVEEVSGLSYGEYLQEHIFKPLEMERSFTDPVAARAAGLAQGHTQMLAFPLPRQQPHMNFDIPAGFIMTTAQDMAHYLIVQGNAGSFEGRPVLSPAWMDEMHQPPDGIDSSYSMGWESSSIDSIPTIQHSGGLESFYARAIVLPEHGYGLAVMINQNGLLNLAIYERITDDLVRILLEREPDGGLSLSTVYFGIAAVMAIDLGRHVHAFRKLGIWQVWAGGKSTTRKLLDTGWNLAIPLVVLAGLPALSMITLGLSTTRVLIFYYLPDISLWIALGSLLCLVRGILKVRIYQEMKGGND